MVKGGVWWVWSVIDGDWRRWVFDRYCYGDGLREREKENTKAREIREDIVLQVNEPSCS